MAEHHALFDDGALTITVIALSDFDPPCRSGMEIQLSAPHLSHWFCSSQCRRIGITLMVLDWIYLRGRGGT
jgi:hypothetical protein